MYGKWAFIFYLYNRAQAPLSAKYVREGGGKGLYTRSTCLEGSCSMDRNVGAETNIGGWVSL
jgi:hypothetical protein